MKKIIERIAKVANIALYLCGAYILFHIAHKAYLNYKVGIFLPPVGTLANWSQVIVAYAAIFAIAQYLIAFWERADNKTNYVLLWVKFFRESIIKSADEIFLKIKKDYKNKFPYLPTNKNTPQYKFTKREFFNKINQNQRHRIEEYAAIIDDDSSFERKLRECLNCIEEFSIAIVNSDSGSHPAVSSIKKPYIEIIELLALPLYFYIGQADDDFSYTSQLF